MAHGQGADLAPSPEEASGPDPRRGPRSSRAKRGREPNMMELIENAIN